MLGLKTIIEGLLFVSDRPLGVAQIAEIIEDPSIETYKIKEIIGELNREYQEGERAFVIKEVADGYRLRTIIDLAPYALRLKRDTPAKLSKAALETLAIIAYRQPVLRAEVEKIRGVDAGGTIRALLDKELIRISSRRESLPGRPMLYSTTDKFLETFELNDLASLPTIDEIKKICPPNEPRLF
ncbi:MAG: SMC-Scp complex subunit ScpB [Deltaproteobacteria bacterium]|jgi:segregation and condensation protein B|nr:SMC-Scp complex subunit ScpB [Deltaproteobacteria bacterium]